MAQPGNIIVVCCTNCGTRFKIRNPVSGMSFKCSRCRQKITIQTPEQKPATSQSGRILKSEIIKIELHRPSFRKSTVGQPAAPSEPPCFNSVQPQEPQEDALVIKNTQSGRLAKKIFASDVQNRQRLLYLIYLYTRPQGDQQQRHWIRKLPLQVFMFEGVVAEIFDWDYAPASVFVNEGRVFLNISQEGEEDLFALLMDDYVHNLKLTTAQHRIITTYQITPKGLDFITRIPPSEKEAVDRLVSCPQCGSALIVKRRVDSFYLLCNQENCDYERRSTITDAEDVSYFCVPYFPPTITNFRYQPSPQIPQRLKKYFQGHPGDNIKDTLEELIYLSNVKVLIGEWLPFSSNHMAALNYKLGSNERIQSAKFTQEVDTSPEETTIDIPESLTLVKVRDYSLASYVDFEAFCYLPEDPQIIQIEEFGVHLDFTGQVRYGLKIMAVNERDQDKISLDHLPRVLVDIVQDSTTIMDTLLTSYQKSLLEIIFQGKARYRDKYYFILADALHCFKEPERENVSDELLELLNQVNYRDEINQVTEEIKEIVIFADKSILITGSHGSILVTKCAQKYERLVSDFLFAMNIEIFLNNFFTRLFLMNDELKDIQKLIKNCEKDPTAIATVQQMLSRTSGDVILMEELRSYLHGAISIFQEKLEEHYQNYSEEMQEALQTFRVKAMTKGLSIRIKDMQQIIKGTHESLQGLTRITDVISERQMRRIQETLSHNTRSLEDITKTSERSGLSLRILEIILAGGLAFNIMDQFTGEWSVSQNSWLHSVLQPIFDIPGAWLLLSILLWAAFALGIFLLMRWIEDINARAIVARFKIDLPCDIEALKRYLASKNIVTHNADIFNISNFIKVGWEETDVDLWQGNRPKIELVYDEKNGFLLSAHIEIGRPKNNITVARIQELLQLELQASGAVAQPMCCQ